MSAIDFSRSYMRWTIAPQVRILIDAVCTLTDNSTGESKAYYLIAPCRAEDTHGDAGLFYMPSYEFCGIWAEDESHIIRTHWFSHRDNRQNRYREGDAIDVREFSQTRQLPDNESVFDATMGSTEPLISRTTLHDGQRGITAVLEYPVNTMNVKEDPVRFQVDTGPLIVPDFERDCARPIECFEVAYIVYNRFDEAHFILRRPVAGREGTTRDQFTTDYSEIQIMDAENELLLAVSD